MAFSGSGATTGAKYGSVVPFLGTSIGALAGGLFGGGGGGGPFQSGMADETAYATMDFKEIFGRDPTAAELAQIVPAYVGADQHIPNKAQGKAFVAQMFQAQENTPEKIHLKDQEDAKKKAPEHYDSVNQVFQSELGRAASQDELDHFGGLLASGEADSYAIQQFLREQPEYTEKKDLAQKEKIKQENLALQEQMKTDNASFQTDAQGKIKGYASEAGTKNKAFQDELSGKLAGYDQQYFGEQILPTIQQSFAKQGRSFDSSGFSNSATQSAQQQNIVRQQYLASLSSDQYNQVQQQQAAMESGLMGVSAGQYGNLQSQQAAQQAYLTNLGANQYGQQQANSYQQYANMLAQQQQMSNANIQAQYQNTQNVQNRSNELSDYNTQMQAYNQYLAKYGKRNNGLGGAIGGVAGGALGAYFGGPMGAMAGYSAGSNLGTGLQNSFGGSY